MHLSCSLSHETTGFKGTQSHSTGKVQAAEFQTDGAFLRHMVFLLYLFKPYVSSRNVFYHIYKNHVMQSF